MPAILVSQAPAALRARQAFRTRSVVQLRAETFHRLSGDPAPLGGLTPVQRTQILAARSINRDHYLPFCATCGTTVTYDHTAGGFRTWLHEDESNADHIAEVTSARESYGLHPDGLRYVVWADTDVLAWITNDGTVRHVDGTTAANYRAMVRAALGDAVPPMLNL